MPVDMCTPFLKIFARLARCLRHWWHVTTDADYLQSRISRRQSWKASLNIIVLIGFAVDFASAARGECEWWWPVADLPNLVVAGCYSVSHIRSDNLCVDCLVTAILVCGVGACYASYTSQDFPDQQADNSTSQLGFGWLPGIMAVAGFLGVHSLSVITLWVVSVLWCLAVTLPTTASVLEFWQPILTTTSICFASVGMEFTVALLFREWQRQLRCTENLLEGATDGFGAVDCSSGVILEASPKLLETLGAPLVGHPLTSRVVHHGDTVSLAKLLGDAEKSLLPESVLVTWSAPGGKFELDVRIMPYQVLDSRIDFCLQSVGEKRSPAIALASSHLQPQQQEAEAGTPDAPGVGAAPAAAAADGPGDVMAAADSCTESLVPSAGQGQQQQPPAPIKATRGTLSLSSWSFSCGGSNNGDVSAFPLPQEAAATVTEAVTVESKKKVDTRTVAVQVDPPAQKPPAPMAASTATQAQRSGAFRKKRAARAWRAAVVEDKPKLQQFKATPKSTRSNGFRQLVLSFNSGGQGCCQRHISWMGAQGIVTEEMLKPCSRMPLSEGWQCPECLALNDDQAFAELHAVFDDDLPFLVCGLCHEMVDPSLLANNQKNMGIADDSGDAATGSPNVSDDGAA